MLANIHSSRRLNQAAFSDFCMRFMAFHWFALRASHPQQPRGTAGTLTFPAITPTLWRQQAGKTMEVLPCSLGKTMAVLPRSLSCFTLHCHVCLGISNP